MRSTVVPLKHLVRINERSLPETTEPELEFEYVDIGSVGRGTLLDPPIQLTFADAPSRARRLVRAGDTIISTVRTYLRAVWPVEEPTSDLVVSTGFAVLTPRPQLDPRYLGWLAQSDVVVDGIVAHSVGVSYPAINAHEIGDLCVPLIALSEQRMIADFLDTETACIDALATRKRQLRVLLQQRRWAKFDALVGAIDAQVVPLRRALISVTDGPFGSAFSSSEYSEDGVVVVRLGNIGFAQWIGDGLAFLPARRAKEFEQFRVQPGDLLVAGLGDVTNHAGRACVAPDLGPAIVKGKCFCARIDQAVAIPMYLALYCSSPSGAKAMAVEARGSTRSMINLDIFKSMPIPLPSLSIQRRIVEAVQVEWDKTTAISDGLDRQIALLEERRQALITAAVTGELDLAEAG